MSIFDEYNPKHRRQRNRKVFPGKSTHNSSLHNFRAQSASASASASASNVFDREYHHLQSLNNRKKKLHIHNLQ